MTIWNNENARNWSKFLCLLGLAVLALYLCYVIGKTLFGPILVAVMLRVLFQPLHARIQSFFHREKLASAVSTVLVFFLAATPLLVLGSAVHSELSVVAQSLRAAGPQGGLSPIFMHWRHVLLERLGNYSNLGAFDFHATLLRWAEQASRYLLSIGTSIVGNLLSFTLDTVVVFFTLFFLFQEGDRVLQSISELLPFDADQTNRLFTGIGEAIVGNLYGSLAVGLAQGTLTGLSFWVLGISAPVLWALVTALASMVPVVGSALVWAPASLALLAAGHWVKAVILLVWGAAVIGQVDVLVRPWVVSTHAKAHPLLVFFALLGGAKAFGAVGIFVGPIALSFVLAVVDMLRNTDFSSHSMQGKPQLGSVSRES
jgi:predicted PurR-regulated permease PerM